MGARAASSHTGALAGNDKIYEDVFKQSGVIRAQGAARHARVRARDSGAADAEGRERRHHHRRRRLGRAAVRCVRRQRPDADGDAARSRRGVPQIHSAVRRGGQSGRHHRRRAAEDVPEHDPPGPRGPAHPCADPRLLAHDHHAADGVREARGRGGRRDARRRGSQAGRRVARRRRRGRGSGRISVRPWHSGLSVLDRDAGRRCWAPSTSGRAARV